MPDPGLDFARLGFSVAGQPSTSRFAQIAAYFRRFLPGKSCRLLQVHLMTAFSTGVCAALANATQAAALRLGVSSSTLAALSTLVARLPLVAAIALLTLWPNLLNWVQEGRFTAEVDATELRADRSQVADSWRARGLMPEDPTGVAVPEQPDDGRATLRQHQTGYGTVRTADGALLYA
jgi:hypothetical protein